MKVHAADGRFVELSGETKNIRVTSTGVFVDGGGFLPWQGGAVTRTILASGTHGRYAWRAEAAAIDGRAGEFVEMIFDLPDGRTMWRELCHLRGYGGSIDYLVAGTKSRFDVEVAAP